MAGIDSQLVIQDLSLLACANSRELCLYCLKTLKKRQKLILEEFDDSKIFKLHYSNQAGSRRLLVLYDTLDFVEIKISAQKGQNGEVEKIDLKIEKKSRQQEEGLPEGLAHVDVLQRRASSGTRQLVAGSTANDTLVLLRRLKKSENGGFGGCGKHHFRVEMEIGLRGEDTLQKVLQADGGYILAEREQELKVIKFEARTRKVLRTAVLGVGEPENDNEMVVESDEEPQNDQNEQKEQDGEDGEDEVRIDLEDDEEGDEEDGEDGEDQVAKEESNYLYLEGLDWVLAYNAGLAQIDLHRRIFGVEEAEVTNIKLDKALGVSRLVPGGFGGVDLGRKSGFVDFLILGDFEETGIIFATLRISLGDLSHEVRYCVTSELDEAQLGLKTSFAFEHIFVDFESNDHSQTPETASGEASGPQNVVLINQNHIIRLKTTPSLTNPKIEKIEFYNLNLSTNTALVPIPTTVTDLPPNLAHLRAVLFTIDKITQNLLIFACPPPLTNKAPQATVNGVGYAAGNSLTLINSLDLLKIANFDEDNISSINSKKELSTTNAVIEGAKLVLDGAQNPHGAHIELIFSESGFVAKTALNLKNSLSVVPETIRVHKESQITCDGLECTIRNLQFSIIKKWSSVLYIAEETDPDADEASESDSPDPKHYLTVQKIGDYDLNLKFKFFLDARLEKEANFVVSEEGWGDEEERTRSVVVYYNCENEDQEYQTEGLVVSRVEGGGFEVKEVGLLDRGYVVDEVDGDGFVECGKGLVVQFEPVKGKEDGEGGEEEEEGDEDGDEEDGDGDEEQEGDDGVMQEEDGGEEEGQEDGEDEQDGEEEGEEEEDGEGEDDDEELAEEDQEEEDDEADMQEEGEEEQDEDDAEEDQDDSEEEKEGEDDPEDDNDEENDDDEEEDQNTASGLLDSKLIVCDQKLSLLHEFKFTATPETPAEAEPSKDTPSDWIGDVCEPETILFPSTPKNAFILKCEKDLILLAKAAKNKNKYGLYSVLCVDGNENLAFLGDHFLVSLNGFLEVYDLGDYVAKLQGDAEDASREVKKLGRRSVQK